MSDPTTTERVAVWEARTVTDLATILRRYIAENPCPGPSALVGDMWKWSNNLSHSGVKRRDALVARYLVDLPGAIAAEIEAERVAAEAAAERDRERQESRAWRRTSPAARERIVIEVLGEQRLTFGELICDHLPKHGPRFDPTSLRKVLQRLLNAGEIERVNEWPPEGGRRRYVYSRRTGLSGPIADLDRQFNDDGGPA